MLQSLSMLLSIRLIAAPALSQLSRERGVGFFNHFETLFYLGFDSGKLNFHKAKC